GLIFPPPCHRVGATRGVRRHGRSLILGTLPVTPGCGSSPCWVYNHTVDQTATTVPTVPTTKERSKADEAMRHLLHVPDQQKPIPESATHKIFGTSILLSATRCLLSYIVLPILLPL